MIYPLHLKPRSKKIAIMGMLLVLMIGTYLLVSNKPPVIDNSKIADLAVITYPAEYNYRQTINDCGPFNVAAVVRALTQQNVSSAEFAKNIGWRLPNKYTLPWGLQDQLKVNGITIELPHLKALTDAEKISFLQERLSAGKPIIILGERDGYEHYITLLGFDIKKDIFYVYDSFFDKGKEGLTINKNDNLPGNRNLTSQELLTFWQGGGMYGLYDWYAIVGYKK